MGGRLNLVWVGRGQDRRDAWGGRRVGMSRWVKVGDGI